MVDLFEQLQERLASSYVLEREIGRGGMATVYLARDIKHDRRVAVKVLNPELGAVLGVERFLSEIKVTANLQHPNLLPLFDSGDANGYLYYVMPYVEGSRSGRDSNGSGGSRVTQTGLSLGTPQYMSPEQATGDRAIDGRSDIYSLGAILYEMLAGEPPHVGGTVQATIAKVLTDPVRPLRALDGDHTGQPRERCDSTLFPRRAPRCDSPLWSRDGRTIFYSGGKAHVAAAIP
jgi:serine/threonine protein kinase